MVLSKGSHLGLLTAAVLAGGAHGCSVFAAGKKATADGSVIISHQFDGDVGLDSRVLYVPAHDYIVGLDKRPIFYAFESFPRYVGVDRGPYYYANNDTGSKITPPIGHIDQVKHTYGYQSSTYGVLNEYGVSVAESTCGAMFGTCGKGSSIGCEPGRKTGSALMSIDTLSELAMERTTSSREAVELMGEYATKYGFYGPPDSFEGSGESLIVGDPNEAWAFQILSDPTGTSAIWAAQRVPDENVTVVANMFTIRDVDPNDHANFILSPNIFEIAKGKGWWKEGEPLDFTKMYSGGEYAHKYYSGRRMWGLFRMSTPSVQLPDEYEDIRYKPVYPWSLKPDKLVTHRDFMSWHRDWYGGTKYDMTKGLKAGPFGSPDRFAASSKEVKGNWERSITLYRTNVVYLQHLRNPSKDLPQQLASVAWIGSGPAHYTTFLPVPAGVSITVPAFQWAQPHHFETKSMWWAVRKVMDVCQIRFDKMHALVEKAQKDVEDAGDVLLEGLLKNWTTSQDINGPIVLHADLALQRWQQLALDLIFKYSDNTDIATAQPLNYPDEWLQGVGFKDGPPDAPVEDQCPPNCAGEKAEVIV